MQNKHKCENGWFFIFDTEKLLNVSLKAFQRFEYSYRSREIISKQLNTSYVFF